MVNPKIVRGDLLDQPVEVIVNAWNQNFIPWWLLLPQGVSGAIKRRGGTKPFRELSRRGFLRLGDAVVTSAGRLPFKAVIHVAGINFIWRASEYSIRRSVVSAMKIVEDQGFSSVAFPIIGAGSGGFGTRKALAIMENEFSRIHCDPEVIIVEFGKP